MLTVQAYSTVAKFDMLTHQGQAVKWRQYASSTPPHSFVGWYGGGVGWTIRPI